MPDPIRFAIGIQARSTSTRYPNKIECMIGDKTVLDRIVETCKSVAFHVNKWRWPENRGAIVSIALCIPEGDPIKSKFSGLVNIIEGHEQDVLSRYIKLNEHFNSDYVVRITGDCPLILDQLISKHIFLAGLNQYDYTSNVDEECRTAPDGYDCEVISKRLLLEANNKAITPSDREHVTTWIRREMPTWATSGFVIGNLDRSGDKISLDTLEDEKRILDEFEKIKTKKRIAVKKYGKTNVHTFS